MYQGANNYSLPQGSYDPRTTPQITINTGASYAGGYGPGYGPCYGQRHGPGFGRRVALGCHICGFRRCRCNSFGGPVILNGGRQSLLSTVVGGAMNMMSDRSERDHVERQAIARRRMEEDMQYDAHNRELGQDYTHSQDATRDYHRGRQYGSRNRDVQSAKDYSEDESDEENRVGQRNEKHLEGSSKRVRKERLEEELPSYQSATRRN